MARGTVNAGYGLKIDLPLQVNTDWNAAGGVAQILNKPATSDQWSKKAFMLYVDDVLEVGTKFISTIVPYDLEIKEIKLAVDMAPTGTTLIADINLNGTTIYTTQNNRPTIAINEVAATAALPDIVNISAGDKLSLDIDQVGSAAEGENLAVTISCTLREAT
jgi:hypothetical protein